MWTERHSLSECMDPWQVCGCVRKPLSNTSEQGFVSRIDYELQVAAFIQKPLRSSDWRPNRSAGPKPFPRAYYAD
ncbi:protein of unknown function [Cyanobium sp. NIES-981]|nr:protein of unknown function [Cyanobium sp. NIES-981]